MERVVKSGLGWRIGWNPEAGEFTGLVGSDDWAIELTQAELEDFCQLLSQLSTSMEAIAHELMDQEKITCEAETNLLWMEVAGYPHAYTLRLILHSGRRSEAYWSESVVPDLWQAVQSLQVFLR
ncbi:DUF1818 family protein [Merismopedia glauca]|uniref:DUF1818 domain-containing protein n=1 Tax=Merismopedia glauca CCAP 1448/3 TaxID=1296344 RepID=A0A2T1C6P5_9CYAN|nr:DUF1818 family protein [Merismopedia glauca]PSB03813.1 DUF1818 domain-containing protein [Merismopedia glauca CCAP 1448/3]